MVTFKIILQTHLTVHMVSDSTHWHSTPHLCCCQVEGFLLICSFWKDTDWNWIHHFDLQEKKNLCRYTLQYSKQTLPIYYMFPWLFVKVKIFQSMLLVCSCCNETVMTLCLLYACSQPKKANIEKFTIKLSYHSYSASDTWYMGSLLSVSVCARTCACVCA